MSTPVTYYRCELCTRDYATQAEADTCQASHLVPQELGQATWNERSTHPETIVIVFPGSATWTYRREG
jgi:hypothetical protein